MVINTGPPLAEILMPGIREMLDDIGKQGMWIYEWDGALAPPPTKKFLRKQAKAAKHATARRKKLRKKIRKLEDQL